MSKEKNKEKTHMLSGLFDNARDFASGGGFNNPLEKKEEEKKMEDISGEIAKVKLKKIKEVIEA